MHAPDRDPSVRIERAFAAIAAGRMADLPICNPALAVRAVGFREVGETWLGVLVTPWCMNLMCLPREEGQPPPAGTTVSLSLPSGDYPFVAGFEDAVGGYLACSLFSPMEEFASQAQAEAVAAEAMRALMQGAPSGARRALLRGVLPLARP